MKNSFNLLFKKKSTSLSPINGFFYFSLFFLLISCNQSTESKINNSVQNLIKKYPYLRSNKEISENEFKFTKSVKEGKFNIEAQLFSPLEGYGNGNQILVIINGKNEVYSIPLFNNKYKDYWEFPSEKSLPGVPKINTTFSNEFNIAIDKLIHNSDRKKSLKRLALIHETIYSLLDCKKIQARDSLELLNSINLNPYIPDENPDSAKTRIRTNYNLMKLSLQSESSYMNCYFDRKNARIYQIENHVNKIKIKTYRNDRGFHVMYY